MSKKEMCLGEKKDELFNSRIVLMKNLKESISIYLFLKSEYQKGDIVGNYPFQYVFRSFYRLDNAGLTDSQKDIYFQLLENKETNLKIILSKLYDEKTLRNIHSIQFSFATKLIHTIDNDKPIYDKYIKKFTGIINYPSHFCDKEEKINATIQKYESLIAFFNELAMENKMFEIISDFRSKYGVTGNELSDIKILDFMIWSYGKTHSVPSR